MKGVAISVKASHCLGRDLGGIPLEKIRGGMKIITRPLTFVLLARLFFKNIRRLLLLEKELCNCVSIKERKRSVRGE